LFNLLRYNYKTYCTYSFKNMKLVTWNIASHLEDDRLKRIQSTLQSTNADIIALQECPPSFSLPGYKVHCMQPSHCGYTTILSKHKVTYTKSNLYGSKGSGIHFKTQQFQCDVVSIHLTPFNFCANKRLEELKEIVDSCGINALIMGDFNMRKNELSAMERLGLREMTGLFKVPYTWDSTINKFNGPTTYGFRCMFDRVFIKGNPPLISNIERDMFPDREENTYLSDHFGLVIYTKDLPSGIQGPDTPITDTPNVIQGPDAPIKDSPSVNKYRIKCNHYTTRGTRCKRWAVVNKVCTQHNK